MVSAKHRMVIHDCGHSSTTSALVSARRRSRSRRATRPNNESGRPRV